MELTNSSAVKMLYYFEEISKIPRPSGHEEKIADYIEAFLKARGIEHKRDEKQNIFASLPASEGREGEDAILFQGHTDMVCEADTDVAWDVYNEGVTLLQEGDWLHAKGTTLGGDDGFAVAMMLALLDGEVKSHPKMEFLFTADEEVGLGGALAFDMSCVTAPRLINLDSEEEDRVLVSCAGGVRMDLTVRYSFTDFDGLALKLTIDELAGGHSGADIHLGRANANRELAKALKKLCEKIRVNIASVNGGSKDNAITRSASAVFAVTDLEAAQEILAEAEKEFRAGLCEEDKNAVFKVERILAPEKMLSHRDSRQLADFITMLPYGVLEMNKNLGIVETSANVGVVCTNEYGVSVSMLCRSADDKKLDDVDYIVTRLCETFGAEKETRNGYPGWSYSPDSKLCKDYSAAFEKVMGKKPVICGIHAGLECGIFKKKAPDMDMISIGADIFDVHTPRERMSVSSCENIWQIICELLKA